MSPECKNNPTTTLIVAHQDDTLLRPLPPTDTTYPSVLSPPPPPPLFNTLISALNSLSSASQLPHSIHAYLQIMSLFLSHLILRNKPIFTSFTQLMAKCTKQ